MNHAAWPSDLPPFLWGVATSSHQVEGGNEANDWAAWAAASRLPEAGRAVDHWNLYRDDFGRFRALSLNAYRFSLEWSRIEPEPGRFDRAALDHYRQMVEEAHRAGLTPLVTLHHFTLPAWLARAGGFLAPDALRRFAAYVETAVQALPTVRFWCTINEPGVLAVMGYLEGTWPPFHQNARETYRLLSRLIQAHRLTYPVIKRLYPDSWVGLAHNMLYPLPEQDTWGDRLAARLTHRAFNLWVVDRVGRDQDYVGLNYYSPSWTSFRHLLQPTLRHTAGPVTDMGWEADAEGLRWLLTTLGRRYRRPVLVTENGIATEDDGFRARYLSEHLAAVARARREGVDVRGYFYWSGLDNYEWAEGFRPRFGLYRVDYDTLTRTLKPGAEILREWARQGPPV